MSDKYKGIYRNESARLKNWDYGSDGAYFITICTDNRAHYFGEIENGKMHFSPAGAIADVLWYEIKHHTKNVELGEYVVMPNHVHGILIIRGGGGDVGGRRDVACNVPTTTTTTIDETAVVKNEKMAAISPQSNTISTIIRSYKSAVTKHCHRLKLEFAWQTRFYDHIIRNDESFNRISEYIKNNPANWPQDKLHSTT